MLKRGNRAGVYVPGICDSSHREMSRPVLSGERMQNMRTGNASSLGRSVEQRAGGERMKIEDLEKYSKRSLIRAYLCAHSEGQSGCPAGGGEHCKMMKGCRKVTPADWWNEDVLPEYKDFTPVQLAERCRRGACPVKNGCCPFWPTPDGWCALVTDEMWEDIAE